MGEEDVDTCARCDVPLGAERVIVLHGSLVIMYCSACAQKEAHRVTRSGTHSMLFPPAEKGAAEDRVEPHARKTHGQKTRGGKLKPR
jgi:NAD-dependent SIR2 family protein deacetylase